MGDSKIVFLLDREGRRRARIAHRFTQNGITIIPFEGAVELRLPSPSAALCLVHDDGLLLEATLNRLEASGAWMPVIAFAENPRPERVVDAVFAGAMDYIGAPFCDADLRESFAKVAVRAAKVRGPREAGIRARYNMERLSQREREVVSALSDGLTNKHIAKRLSISPRTVEIHRTNALGKLGAANSYDAIKIVLEAKAVRTN